MLIPSSRQVLGKIIRVREVDRMTERIHHLYHPTIYDQTVKHRQKPTESTKNFGEILANKQTVKISKHAKERMVERNIYLSDRQWATLSSKLKEAKQKGVRESVVVLNNATLLVNAEKHTIITALNNDEAESKIFTNINGTIILTK